MRIVHIQLPRSAVALCSEGAELKTGPALIWKVGYGFWPGEERRGKEAGSFSDAEKAFILTRQRRVRSAMCVRKVGISQATFYSWAGLLPTAMRRLEGARGRERPPLASSRSGPTSSSFSPTSWGTETSAPTAAESCGRADAAPRPTGQRRVTAHAVSGRADHRRADQGDRAARDMDRRARAVKSTPRRRNPRRLLGETGSGRAGFEPRSKASTGSPTNLRTSIQNVSSAVL